MKLVVGRAETNGVELCSLTSSSTTVSDTCIWYDEIAVLWWDDASGSSDPSTVAAKIVAASS